MAEPPLKRQHLDEILYKINHGSLRVFTPGPGSIKIYHITSTISLKEDVLVKHRGKVLSPLDCIPCTNAEDPLIFITEVGKLYISHYLGKILPWQIASFIRFSCTSE